MEKVKKIFINFILTLDALIPMAYVFFIKERMNLYPSFLKGMFLRHLNSNLLGILRHNRIYILALSYLIVMILLSFFIILVIQKKCTKDKIEKGSVEEIDIAIDNFLPSYLGYFFVALSIPSLEVFYILFVLIFLLVYKSKLSHFNPIFLILGYKYYYYTSKGIKSLLITKRKLRNPKEVEIDSVVRINDFTYIEQ